MGRGAWRLQGQDVAAQPGLPGASPSTDSLATGSSRPWQGHRPPTQSPLPPTSPARALLGQTALSHCVLQPSFFPACLRLRQGVLLPFSDLLSCPRGKKTRTFFLLPESHYLLGEPQPIYVSRERHSMPPSPKTRPWLGPRPSAGRHTGLWPRRLSALFLARRTMLFHALCHFRPLARHGLCFLLPVLSAPCPSPQLSLSRLSGFPTFHQLWVLWRHTLLY